MLTQNFQSAIGLLREHLEKYPTSYQAQRLLSACQKQIGGKCLGISMQLLKKADLIRLGVVDKVKIISDDEMKAILSNTSDTISALDLTAPKEPNGEISVALPSRNVRARKLLERYRRNFASRSMDEYHFSKLESPDALASNQGEPKDISCALESSASSNRDQNQKLLETQVPRDDQIPQTPSPEYNDGYHLEYDIFASTSIEAAAPFVTIPVSSVAKWCFIIRIRSFHILR